MSRFLRLVGLDQFYNWKKLVGIDYFVFSVFCACIDNASESFRGSGDWYNLRAFESILSTDDRSGCVNISSLSSLVRG